MSEPDRIERTPDEARASAALRALAPPEADPEFRAALRRAFSADAFDALRPRVLVLPRRRPVWRWLAVPAAAAAVIAVAFVLNRGPAWRVESGSGDGMVLIDGRPVPVGHLEDLSAGLRPGVRLRVPDSAEIELRSPGQMAIAVTPGTDMTLPAPPGRWWGRGVRTEVESGELRIMTGAAFHGARLAIETPDAMVQVTGTTLAVILDPDGTCVCVLDGHVRVGRKGGEMADVEHGHLRFVFNDTRPPKVAEMRPTERVMLTAFRNQRREGL